jgi:hypothetical protein
MTSIQSAGVAMLYTMVILMRSISAPAQTLFESQELLASDGHNGDYFGNDVAISGDVAIIGARWHDVGETNAGAAYVFRRNGSSWDQQQKLWAFDGDWNDDFGAAVSVSGDVVVVSAYGDEPNGSAYVFRWNGSSWAHEQKLLPSEGGSCGYSLAVEGDVCIVGCPGGNGGNGAAFVFQRNSFPPGSWVEIQRLVATDGAIGDQFGCAVSISADVAVVGAFSDDDHGINSGAAYLFRQNPLTGLWVKISLSPRMAL